MWNFLLISTACLMLSLFYRYYFGEPISMITNSENEYDYIIVGAGTAGCVIASRLSESPEVSVLLVEAGGYFGWLSSIPLAAPLLQGTTTDWAYVTESQEFSSRGLHDQKQFWPRGKGLGGSGQINYLLHSYGVPEDYVNWPAGWSYADLEPYFKRVESIMDVSTVSGEEKLAEAFYKSEMEIARKNATFRLARNTLKKGARWSSYHAYLHKAWNRKNLHILINTLVTRVLFENLTAEAIEVQFSNGTTDQIKAKKEIIICGGAVNSPQLLMLSGIGPARDLQEHNIPVVSHLEGVGKNLYDHMNVPVHVNLHASVSVTSSKLMSLTEIFKYYVLGSGLFASNAIVGTGRSGYTGFVLFGMGSADETILKDIANFHTKTFRAIFPSYADTKHEGFLYLASCLQPKSRGNVTLRSKNFFDSPMINPGYLANDDDIVCTHDAINLALKTLETRPFIDLGASANIPDLDECNCWQKNYSNRRFTECLARTAGLTSYHPGGTCKLGREDDDTAVVDEHLRVIGVDRLRIMDASVLPNPISGTPNSVIIAMAERAVDVIMEPEVESGSTETGSSHRNEA